MSEYDIVKFQELMDSASDKKTFYKLYPLLCEALSEEQRAKLDSDIVNKLNNKNLSTLAFEIFCGQFCKGEKLYITLFIKNINIDLLKTTDIENLNKVINKIKQIKPANDTKNLINKLKKHLKELSVQTKNKSDQTRPQSEIKKTTPNKIQNKKFCSKTLFNDTSILQKENMQLRDANNELSNNINTLKENLEKYATNLDKAKQDIKNLKQSIINSETKLKKLENDFDSYIENTNIEKKELCNAIDILKKEKEHEIISLKNKIVRQLSIRYYDYKKYNNDLTNDQLHTVIKNIFNDLNDLNIKFE